MRRIDPTDPWKVPVFAALTAAYWGVSLLGFTCFVYRRQYEALTDYYLKKRYPGYDEDFGKLAGGNVMTDVVVNRLNPQPNKKLATQIQTCIARLYFFSHYCYPTLDRLALGVVTLGFLTNVMNVIWIPKEFSEQAKRFKKKQVRIIIDDEF